MKRGSSGLCAIVAIDKPKDITSHDVVARIRNITGERRVGHAGTLDPMATGLLLVCIGPATRLCPYLSAKTKNYDARIVFGVATDTDDAQGRFFGEHHTDLQDSLAQKLLDKDFANKTLENLKGPLEQVPPAYCAIKKDGITAYKAARAGKSIELDVRHVNIFDAKLVSLGKDQATIPDIDGQENTYDVIYWDVKLDVSKGTYIRSIARDLGTSFGCGAHLGALRRTKIASILIDDEQTRTLDSLEAEFKKTAQLPCLDPVDVLNLPVLKLDNEQQKLVSCGSPLYLENGDNLEELNKIERSEKENLASTSYIACTTDTHLLAVYERSAEDRDVLKAATVIPGGVAGVR